MAGTLTIRRVQANCHVWGPSEIAAGVADRASRAMRHYLPHTVKAAFAPWLDRNDESVWIVRGLDLTLTTSAEAPPDLLAASFAQSLDHALSDALKGDGDGISVIRFASPATYLARYVVDVAAGVAANRWYYRPFAGLAALPCSAAIRTGLTAVLARGLEALATLDDRSLAAVVTVLTKRDERRLIDLWGGMHESDAAPDDRMFRAAWAAFERAWDLGLERGRALFAFVRADESVRSRAFAHALSALDDAVRAADSGSAPLSSDSVASIIGPVPPTLFSAIATRRRIRQVENGGLEASAQTRIGGVFLLLRDLDRLPFVSSTAEWPSLRGATPPAMLRWLTLMVCVGSPQSRAAASDATLPALFGVPHDLEIADIVSWLRDIGHQRRRMLDIALASEAELSALTHADRRWLALPGIRGPWRMTLATAARIVLVNFAQRLPGFADSTPEHLWRNFLAFDAAIEHEDTRVVVRCGKPRLHLVLALTGMTRGLLAGCDARGRPLYLFPRE
jgi:hypothetical protein